MDLLDLPENPVPAGARVVPVTTEDGVRLRAVLFPATTRPARGTILVCHGRTEQIEKYFHVVEKLRARGLAVVTFDWRGQGGSARLLRDTLRGHVRSFDDYALDIDAVRRQLVLPDCPAPYFGLAHSMGALAMLHAAPGLTPFLSRMVLVAPFMDLAEERLPRRTIERVTGLLALLGLGGSVVPGGHGRTKVPTFEDNVLTSDPQRFKVMQDILALRPDLAVGPPTNAWISAACRAQERIDREDFPARVPMPVMIVNAGADTVVSPTAVERLARRLRTVAYILVPGARHEVLMERPVYADQFWAAFDAFVPGTPVNLLTRSEA